MARFGIWVRDTRKLKGKELVNYIEQYAQKHFLSDKVKAIHVRLRGDVIYLSATCLNDYRTELQKKEIWEEWQVARLTWEREDKYRIAYFRHTGKYWDLPIVGTLDQCLGKIYKNELGLFWIV